MIIAKNGKLGYDQQIPWYIGNWYFNVKTGRWIRSSIPLRTGLILLFSFSCILNISFIFPSILVGQDFAQNLSFSGIVLALFGITTIYYGHFLLLESSVILYSKYSSKLVIISNSGLIVFFCFLSELIFSFSGLNTGTDYLSNSISSCLFIFFIIIFSLSSIFFLFLYHISASHFNKLNGLGILISIILLSPFLWYLFLIKTGYLSFYWFFPFELIRMVFIVTIVLEVLWLRLFFLVMGISNEEYQNLVQTLWTNQKKLNQETLRP